MYEDLLSRLDPRDYYNKKVTSHGNTIKISLETMYERPQITFADLTIVSEYFKTKNVNLYDGAHSPGCDTCDYGSSYEVIIEVKDCDSI